MRLLLSILIWFASVAAALPLGAQPKCKPECGTGSVCQNGACVSACATACQPGETCTDQGTCVEKCNPTCGAGFVCSPDATCVSACNPPCAANELCSPDARCVSACNPLCGANETCTAEGTCVSNAPPPPKQTYSSMVAAAPPGASSASSGVRTHDGFYLSFGLGLGSASATAEPKQGSVKEVSISSLAILGELAIGVTVAPGLVIGGGVYSAVSPSPTYTATIEDVDLGDQHVDDEGEAGSIGQIGPFALYYFDPTGGLYAFGAPTLASVSGGKAKSYPDAVGETSGTGFGVVLGGGYDIWVGDEWSVGGQLRFQYATATLEDDDGDETDFSGTVIGALLTLTYH